MSIDACATRDVRARAAGRRQGNRRACVRHDPRRAAAEGARLRAVGSLADAAGWIDVDPATLRHKQFPDIYALGDATNTTNAKTAAAARKQAPVVAHNLLASLGRAHGDAAYDGYGSCPLTVERGKIVLAEFLYGGKVAPTFPRG